MSGGKRKREGEGGGGGREESEDGEERAQLLWKLLQFLIMTICVFSFFFLSGQTWGLICFINLFKEPVLDMLTSSVGQFST